MDNKDLQELQKQVNDIFLMTSTLTVSGDAIDVVAAVRASLRNLYENIAKLDVKPANSPVSRKATSKDVNAVPNSDTGGKEG